jgi:hypothetical protein
MLISGFSGQTRTAAVIAVLLLAPDAGAQTVDTQTLASFQ